MLLLLMAIALQGGVDWDRWLNEEVVYIISEREAREFQALTTDQERERFAAEFWLRRDPDPSTAVNEYQQEIENRIRYANERFNKEGKPGWRTVRGQTYIIHGPPDDIHYSYGYLQKVPVYNPTQVLNPQGESLPFVYVEFPTPESETWVYRHLPGAQSSRTYFTVVFAKMDPTGLYNLRRFISNSSVVRGVGASAAGSLDRLVLRDQMIKEFITKQNYFRNEYRIVYAGEPRFQDLADFLGAVFEPRGAELSEFAIHEASVDLVRSPGDLLEKIWDKRRRMEEMVTSQVFFGSLEVAATFGFLKSPGQQVRVPFRAEVRFPDGKPSDEVELVAELVDRTSGRPRAQLQDNIKSPSHPVDGGVPYQSRLVVAPGEYTFRIIASDLAGGRIGVWERDLSVPNLSTESFGAGQLLLCDDVTPMKEYRSKKDAGDFGWSSSYGKDAPLALDNLVFEPSLKPRFRRGQTLTTLVEVYNPTLNDDKPDVSVQAFFERPGQPVMATSVATLDYLTGEDGKTILYAFSLPLMKLDCGDYNFTVRFTDAPSGTTVERRASLQIW